MRRRTVLTWRNLTFTRRLLLTWRLFKVMPAIESEWQKLQQEEHDTLYGFQVRLREDQKQDHSYKKGIVDGVKWCMERFK